MLNITLAQINPTIGDISGNIQLMLQAALQAQQQQAHMVIFPELSLTSYYPGDWLDEPLFLTRITQGIAKICNLSQQTPNVCWIIGTPTLNTGTGKPLHNSLLVIQNGIQQLQYDKQLLPTYNIFDEQRHFEPGTGALPILTVAHHRIGFMICEDGWNDSGDHYAVNPFQHLAEAAPDLVVSINASPSDRGKRKQRHDLFVTASRKHQLPVVYVNQVGGQDQLVYDGASFVVTPDAGVIFEAQRFASDITTLRYDQRQFTLADGQAIPVPSETGLATMEFYRQQALLGLRDYAKRCGFSQVVVGCSGGIDSALTLALATTAMGAENVHAITMPSHYSSASSVTDSHDLCRNLGISLDEHPIIELVECYSTGFQSAFQQELQGLARENLQARIRGTILMEYSNAFGHLLLTTGNKSEVSVGYCTLYGDTNGGLNLIGDLYKTEVFELCRHINQVAGRELIPQAIIDKEPSAELAPDQRDSDSLPAYSVLDDILKYLIEGQRLSGKESLTVTTRMEKLQQSEEGRTLIARVRRLMMNSEYKRRQCPPILRMRARAFGSGRQMPIAAQIDLGR